MRAGGAAHRLTASNSVLLRADQKGTSCEHSVLRAWVNKQGCTKETRGHFSSDENVMACRASKAGPDPGQPTPLKGVLPGLQRRSPHLIASPNQIAQHSQQAASGTGLDNSEPFPHL